MPSLGGTSQPYDPGDITLYIKDLRAPTSRKRLLKVKSWGTAKDVKDLLASLLSVPVQSQRLFFRSIELKNNRLLHDAGVDAGHTIFFAIHSDGPQRSWALEPYESIDPPKSLLRIINQIKRGLEIGLAPQLSLEGTGGTYFMFDTRKKSVAAFKPQDEEPFAANNPRGFKGIGNKKISMRPGIDPGEACIREVAAFLCDRDHFLGVPATTLVEARHPAFCYDVGKEIMKLGSLQEFIVHDEMVADISPSKLGVQQVHKIAILDIRLLNSDRNDANILVRRHASQSRHHSHHHHHHRPGAQNTSHLFQGELELIPVDHGYCLPDVLEIGWCDWCWLDWPQLKQPMDQETLKYIAELDPQADAERLGRKLTLREPCLVLFRIAATLLKEGAAAGLSLYDIANIIVRHDLDEKSELERALDRAKDLAHAAVDYSSVPSQAFNQTSQEQRRLLQHCSRSPRNPLGSQRRTRRHTASEGMSNGYSNGNIAGSGGNSSGSEGSSNSNDDSNDPNENDDVGMPISECEKNQSEKGRDRERERRRKSPVPRSHWGDNLDDSRANGKSVMLPIDDQRHKRRHRKNGYLRERDRSNSGSACGSAMNGSCDLNDRFDVDDDDECDSPMGFWQTPMNEVDSLPELHLDSNGSSFASIPVPSKNDVSIDIDTNSRGSNEDIGGRPWSVPLSRRDAFPSPFPSPEDHPSILVYDGIEQSPENGGLCERPLPIRPRPAAPAASSSAQNKSQRPRTASGESPPCPPRPPLDRNLRRILNEEVGDTSRKSVASTTNGVVTVIGEVDDVTPSPPPLLDHLEPPSNIIRSFSYHGLRSQSLYDEETEPSVGGNTRETETPKLRPRENSAAFKQHFTRFMELLIQEIIKRALKRKPDPALSSAEKNPRATR